MKTREKTYVMNIPAPMIAAPDRPEQPYILTLRDMPDTDRPREKIMREGPGVLSTAELLALMLTAGTRKEDIMTMCHRILREYGEKSIMSERNPKRLSQELNIPIVKAAQIVAAMEMGRRLFENNMRGRRMIRTARDVYEYVTSMRDLPREHLRGIYLDSNYKVVHEETLSIGTVDAHIIHPRDVFKPAVEYAAVAVILVHNHPSGNLEPSISDREITEQLIAVGTLLGIPLIDHVIVSSKGFKSVMHSTKSEK